MPQQVNTPVENDLQDEIFGSELEWALRNAFEEDEMDVSGFPGDEDQNPATPPLDLQVGSDDFGDLFGEDEQQTGAQQPRDAAEQPEVPSAKPKAQTGLALPRNALPKEKPAVVEQPQATVVERTVGMLGEMARPGKKKKGKQPVVYTGTQTPVPAAGKDSERALPQAALPKEAPVVVKDPQSELGGPDVDAWLEMNSDLLQDESEQNREYAGAQIPIHALEQYPGMAPLDYDMGEMLQGQDDDELNRAFLFSIAEMLEPVEQQQVAETMANTAAGDHFVGHVDPMFDLNVVNNHRPAHQQQAPVPTAHTGVESNSGGPADAMLHPNVVYTQGQGQQQQVFTPVAQEGAGIAQARPVAPFANLPVQPVKDDIDLAVEHGEWGRWNPKGMCCWSYVEHRRQPYDLNNPRDVHDYMQAVVVSLVRRPFRGENAHTTPAALMWFEQAWKTICQALKEQGHKFNLLEVANQNCVRAFWFWIERGSLLNEYDIELSNPNAKRDIGGAIVTLAFYHEMAENVQQDADAPQYLGEVIDLTRS